MLMRDPSKRYTAEQAIHHIWVKTTAGGAKPALSQKAVENMQTFKSLQRLKKAVLMYIATQTTEKDVTELREQFASLDKDGDGKLSREEMEEALKAHKSLARHAEIIEALDTDRSGFIDYSGTFETSCRILGCHHESRDVFARGQTSHGLCRL